MEARPKFSIIYSEEVISFLDTLPEKARAKIMFNASKARYNQDPKLFKKLVGTDIWNSEHYIMEFSTASFLSGTQTQTLMS